MKRGYHKITIFYAILWLTLFLPDVVLAQYDEEEIIEESVMDETDAPPMILETIDLSTLIRRLSEAQNEVTFSNCEIIASASDNWLKVDKIFYTRFELPDTGPDKIFFYNCTFNLGDSNPLVFNNWSLSRLNIIGSLFYSPVSFEDCSFGHFSPALFENNIFKGDVTFLGDEVNMQSLTFAKNSFFNGLTINGEANITQITQNHFLTQPTAPGHGDNDEVSFQLDMEGFLTNELILEENSFDNNHQAGIFSVNLRQSRSESIRMYQNSMQTIDFSYAAVEKSLLIDSLKVADYIGILNFDFPDANTNIPWYNLGGEKLTLLNINNNGEITPYQAKTPIELSNNLLYNDLISAYAKFNTLYHDRGDMASANDSYIEIKDIETRRQGFMQSIHPTLNNYINYNLNRFLRFFSDYATNPGKSLKMSIWVILFFTLLYMLTFSRWDGLNYNYYIGQYKRLLEYITTSESIDVIFKRPQDDMVEELKLVKSIYEARDKKVPRLLRLFGPPLHFLGRLRYEIIPGLIRFFNFQPESWESMSTGKQFRAGLVLFLIGLGFIIYATITKFINSIILSINSFFSVGFGSMPEEDESFAMYLSILQGITGWFLLTIFTITLFSQVLQNA